MYQINQMSVALPTSLVVTALLCHQGRGVTKAQLVEKVRWLITLIVERGGQVAVHPSRHDTNALGKLVEQVTLLLGNTIDRHTNLLELVFTPAKRFELSYYRNQIIHWFVSEAIIVTSIYSFRKQKIKQCVFGFLLFLVSFFKMLFINGSECLRMIW